MSDQDSRTSDGAGTGRVAGGWVRITWRLTAGATSETTGTAIFPSGAIVSIGRITGNDIVLADEKVSRQHARLKITDAEIILTDLNSTNGSLINGRRRLGSTRWQEGEKLQVGRFMLEIRRAEAEDLAAMEPSADAPRPLSSSDGDTPTSLEGRARPVHADVRPGEARGEAIASGGTGRRLEIVLNAGSVVDVAAPAYVVGTFEDINPTSTKAASALDDKFGGLLAAEVQRHAFDCRVGEVSIVPMPQQQGSLLVFAGMGPINLFTPAALEIVGENLAKVLSAANIREFATVPMGVGAGLSIKDFVVCCLRGFLRGLTATKESEAVRKVWISEFNPERGAEMRREVKTLVMEGFFKKMGFDAQLSETGSHEQPNQSVVRVPRASLVYLHVLHPTETTFEFSLLSPEHGAAIEKHQHTIDLNEQARVAAMTAQLREFDAKIGASLADAYVPTALQALICRSLAETTAHLVVIHDQASSTIPWEAIYFKDRCPALDGGVSRLYEITKRGAARERPVLPKDATLRMLVVENPTGDLVGAQNEATQLAELFIGNRGRVRTLKGQDASRTNVLSELGSGNYDLLHYAGHAEFLEAKPEASGLILTDGVLTAADLLQVEVGKTPQMIFLNACESGRMRGPADGTPAGHAKASHFAGQVSLAESFLFTGIANFIGTYWPVNDLAALQFASTFYGSLLSGKLLSTSMRDARQAAKRVSARDWANYLHFGDPLYTVRPT